MRSNYRFLLVLILIFSSTTLLVAQAEENIWEGEIQKFEVQDETAMPQEGGIVFTGSSSIRGWSSLGEDFPSRNVINRGFGGSQYTDVLYYFDTLISKYQPKQVVMYSGDNDISSGKSPEVVFGTFKKIAEKLKAKHPGTKLAIIAIKPSLARWGLWEKMNDTNQMIKAYAEQQEDVVFIDVATPMLGTDGKPKPEFFVEDGLHMNPKGYALWTQIVEPYLIETK